MATRTVLVIDDEDDIRTVVQMSLEATAGWQVLQARSGRDGVALAAHVRPDLILLDARMPEMDGPAVLRTLREDEATRDIPVVFMTASVRPADREQFLHLGAAGVIGKPFDPVRLAGEISAILRWNGSPAGSPPSTAGSGGSPLPSPT